MAILTGSYGVLLRTLRRAAPLLSGGDSKLATGIRGRERASEVLGSWADEYRDPSRPLVWLHAPSVGESLQARAVLEALREAHGEIQSMFTFFSPSAVDEARAMPADVAGYLPWDVPKDMAALVRRVQPSVVVFTRTEVWPGLTGAAVGAGVPVVLCAGTLAASAGRLGPLARRVLRPTFGALGRVLAVAPDHGERFVELGVPRERIQVTGDPGVDSAASRIARADPSAPHLAPFRDATVPILVAGSTWEPDERVLVQALAAIRRDGRVIRTIVAPHEPTERHLGVLEAALSREGIPSRRLGRVETEGLGDRDAVVIVDRMGVLAELYSVGSIALIGGGFHDDGLHSVVEPAAAGLPVIFGPRHESQPAAAALIEAGACRVVGDAEGLRAAVAEWLDDPSSGREAGAHARAWVQANRGAARRTAEALAAFLHSGEV